MIVVVRSVVHSVCGKALKICEKRIQHHHYYYFCHLFYLFIVQNQSNSLYLQMEIEHATGLLRELHYYTTLIYILLGLLVVVYYQQHTTSKAIVYSSTSKTFVQNIDEFPYSVSLH